MAIKDIKKCPFCGSYAKLRKKNRTVINGQTVRNTYIYCPICDSRGGRVLYKDFDTSDEAEQEAKNLWNRRKLI